MFLLLCRFVHRVTYLSNTLSWIPWRFVAAPFRGRQRDRWYACAVFRGSDTVSVFCTACQISGVDSKYLYFILRVCFLPECWCWVARKSKRLNFQALWTTSRHFTVEMWRTNSSFKFVHTHAAHLCHMFRVLNVSCQVFSEHALISYCMSEPVSWN